VTERRWRVRLSAAAEADLREILRWTTERFGGTQAASYAETLTDALAALAAGPEAIGVRMRDEIAKGLRSLHVERNKHRGRHFILFRAIADEDHEIIEVLRVLHDAMDLSRHLPPGPEKS
jgi:toxin ParE1/3/4